jgi:bis(5'-nucleosyl)-tetraphosphatase (symmetrical)
MAVYAIGDVQGCFDELRLLLDKIAFDPSADQAWFVGDLVNRGPRSLETLRFVKNLGNAAIAVLGNHDLHLLAVAGGVSKTKRRDTFGDILGAPDREELLDWLRRRPLLHTDGSFYLIHAGLPPQWTLEDAVERAREAEETLRGDGFLAFLLHMHGDHPDLWSADLAGWERIRFIVNCLTRIRYIDFEGRLNLKEKGAPGRQAKGLLPWFRAPGRLGRDGQIVFGHWSTLGLHRENGCVCLDTGCLWGGALTALRLADMATFSVPAKSGAGLIDEPD